MFTPFRRHDKTCKYAARGRAHFRCGCPVYADNNLRGRERVCKTLRTRDWEEAAAKVLELNRNGGVLEAPAPEPMTVERAITVFKESMAARQLKAETIGKYELLFRGLRAFAKERNLIPITDLNAEALHHFRATWKETNLTALKKLDRLKAFGNFAVEIGWLTSSPAASLKPPKVRQVQTMPYSDEEMLRLLTSVDAMIAETHRGRANLQRLRALILFLRYSGLRIGDATGCPVERLADGKLRLYTQKTGQHVHIALPQFVVLALELVPQMSARFWFWSGVGSLRTARTKWQTRLAALGKKAKIERLHAHRFRDTFAVKLLLDGTPLERVSILLGHSSIRVTEKHYSPWIRDRQEQAEADVQRSWQRDSLFLLQSGKAEQGKPQ